MKFSLRRPTSLLRTIVPVAIATFTFALSIGTTEGTDIFVERVAPIFQQKCLSCHNDVDHKGGFSLQSRQSAFADGFIEAGSAANSHFVAVITPVDGKAEMPKNASPLSNNEIQIIREWIEAGAKWPESVQLSEPVVTDLDWWSLKPLPPNGDAIARWFVKDTSTENSRAGLLTVRTPIDEFINHKLKERGLVASSEADRATLIRRLYFDLIGLPPSPDEIDTFVSDPRPDAYEFLVEHLLESRHYGERWARHWLDVVHYADTHGYDKDKPRPNAWPYRDYVIRSLNEDKPYDRFVMEQIAGDALWPDTVDGLVGPGFLAAGPWDFIGHAEVPESKLDGKIARNLDRDDMVSTTLNTFCSTTVQCARCHNHKFDPVTQEHYYSLQSVFAALDRADRKYDADPQIAKARNQFASQQSELRAEHARLDSLMNAKTDGRLARLKAEIAELDKRSQEGSNNKPEFGYHSGIEAKQDVEKWVQIDLGKEIVAKSIAVVGCHDDFNGIGHGFGFPVRFRVELSNDATFQNGNYLVVDHTRNDFPNPGTKPIELHADMDKPFRYVRVTATKLAPRQNDFIFALAEVLVRDEAGINVAESKAVSSKDSIEAPVRWQRSNLVDGYYWGAAMSSELLARRSELAIELNQLLEDAALSELQDQSSAVTNELERVNAAMAALPNQSQVYAAIVYSGSGAFVGTGANGGKPRPIFILHRGDIQNPRMEATPGTLPVISGMDWHFALPDAHSESERRVALAKWIVHDKNPLTWRSIVNRVWLYHFGKGISDTPNDLGRMGQIPSHPELLDWLAAEFRDNGRSLKALHRLIVTSSVYRQSSASNPKNAEIDSDNVYLWRMNRKRLTAEEIRDSVLAVSGQLDTSMYGPGFELFAVERPEHSPHYEYDKYDPANKKTHRRTVYRFIVRSQPDPLMTTLDCADSSQSVAKRDETVTALQALSMLNNRFILQMSQAFAERVRTESSDLGIQSRNAYRFATGHAPSDQQQRSMMQYTEEFGLENLCRILFNLNEFVFVD